VELGSINGDNDGSNGSDGVEESSVVVFGKLNVSVNGDFNGLSRRVEFASKGISLVRVVGVLVFRSQTEELDVVEGKFRDCTVATTLTTTLVGILNATDELLSREGLKMSGSNGCSRLNSGNRCEGPA